MLNAKFENWISFKLILVKLINIEFNSKYYGMYFKFNIFNFSYRLMKKVL